MNTQELAQWLSAVGSFVLGTGLLTLTALIAFDIWRDRKKDRP